MKKYDFDNNLLSAEQSTNLHVDIKNRANVLYNKKITHNFAPRKQEKRQMKTMMANTCWWRSYYSTSRKGSKPCISIS